MPSENTVHVAIELSFSSWLVAARLPGIQKVRLHRVEGGNTAALLTLIGELRSRASRELDRTADLACCFEAGRDGFWLQRLLWLTASRPTCLSRRVSWSTAVPGGPKPTG